MRILKKLLAILFSFDLLWYRALRYGVGASIEHKVVLSNIACMTVIDIGANRGQFALAARHYLPRANIISFEPLPGPAGIYRRIFSGDSSVVLHQAAIGPVKEVCTMHISGHDDCSSLLPISVLQGELFPGTEEVGRVSVQVAPLNEFIGEHELRGPSLLKIDVQGFELAALQGCETLLHKFDWIYCECSFMELYSGQKLAADIIEWLSHRGFRVAEIYNPSYDREGRVIQADFLFLTMARMVG